MRKFGGLKIVVFIAFCTLFASVEADAQKRRPARGKTAAAKPASAASNAAAVQQGAQLINNQINNLGLFLFKYGGSLTRIEVIDAEAKQGKLNQTAQVQSDAGKKALVLVIRTFRNAMLKLEDDFRANPALRPYLLQLTGVGEIAGTAEEQAASGQYETAGRTMLQVLSQLTDTLQAMP